MKIKKLLYAERISYATQKKHEKNGFAENIHDLCFI